MKITAKQIRDNVTKVARARNNHVIDATSESEMRQIIQELASDPRKLNTFMRTAFALGFICHELEDEMAKGMRNNFMQAMMGASYIARTIEFANELKTKN